MTKQESIKFLQECIDRIINMSDEEYAEIAKEMDVTFQDVME